MESRQQYLLYVVLGAAALWLEFVRFVPDVIGEEVSFFFVKLSLLFFAVLNSCIICLVAS